MLNKEMQTTRGFTIVEMTITLAIIAILLVLGLSSYSESQKSARDTERRGDAQNIAEAMERFYASGATNQSTGTTYTPGDYPSVTEAQTAGFLADILPGLDAASREYSFSNPSPSDHFRVDYNAGAPTENAESAGVLSRITSATTTDKITYQPLSFNESLGIWVACRNTNDDCRRFKLYYRTEKTINGTTLQVIESNRQ